MTPPDCLDPRHRPLVRRCWCSRSRLRPGSSRQKALPSSSMSSRAMGRPLAAVGAGRRHQRYNSRCSRRYCTPPPNQTACRSASFDHCLVTNLSCHAHLSFDVLSPVGHRCHTGAGGAQGRCATHCHERGYSRTELGWAVSGCDRCIYVASIDFGVLKVWI